MRPAMVAEERCAGTGDTALRIKNIKDRRGHFIRILHRTITKFAEDSYSPRGANALEVTGCLGRVGRRMCSSGFLDTAVRDLDQRD